MFSMSRDDDKQTINGNIQQYSPTCLYNTVEWFPPVFVSKFAISGAIYWVAVRNLWINGLIYMKPIKKVNK